MTITFVNKNFSYNDGTINGGSFPPINHTTGNFLLVFVENENASTTVSLSDTAGNTYTALTPRNYGDSNVHLYPFYAKNIIGHASNVIQIDYGAARNWNRVSCHQYSGIDKTNPFDTEAWTSGNSTTALSSNITPTQKNTLLVSYASWWGWVNTFTSDANYIKRIDMTLEPHGDYPNVCTQDRIVSSIGSYNATTTADISFHWGHWIGAFKAAANPYSFSTIY